MSFKVGDRVEFINNVNGKQFNGTVIKDTGPYSTTNVLIDGENNIFSINGAYSLRNAHLQLLAGTSFTTGSGYGVAPFPLTSFIFNNSDSNTSTEGWTTNNNATCTHEFKTYTGLIKKYDYCTKCDVKKNERGAYEN